MKTVATPFLCRTIWQGIGSLWLGAVILCLLLIAMACATVYESMHGAERALASFYRAWWFLGLVGLLGVNVLVAVLLRAPYTRRQLGFIGTHAGILLILLGAVVTQLFGLAGEVSMAEGESVARVAIDNDVLTISQRGTGQRSTTALPRKPFGEFREQSRLDGPDVVLGDVRVTVDAFQPDTIIAEKVVNDAPHAHRAIEVSLQLPDQQDTVWLFPDQKVTLGPSDVIFRQLSESDLNRVIGGDAADEPASVGMIRVDHSGKRYDTSVESCLENPMSLGDTGLTLRLLRYLPRATVGPDNKLTEASAGPPNPAIEVEISGPEGAARRIAFANFADFQSMHDSPVAGDFKVALIPPTDLAPQAPIEILTGPGSDVFVRFGWEGTAPTIHGLTPDVAVAAPWPDSRLVYHRMFENARVHRSVQPVEPARKRRIPGLRVRVLTSDETFEVWVRRNEPRGLMIGGVAHELRYGAATAPLGFSARLEQFRVSYYPGGQRPRAFESRVTFVDPATGRSQTRVISMNHPTAFGGYHFYQSSYYGEPGQMVSVLSVSRDAGRGVVFAGYILTLVGMMIVLATRAKDRRSAETAGERDGSVRSKKAPAPKELVGTSTP